MNRITRSALAATIGLAAAVVAVPVALPATAATADLANLTGCTGTTATPLEIELDSDYNQPATTLTVPCVAVIDLAGFDINVEDVVINVGQTLTITDTTNDKTMAGTLAAYPAATPGITTTGATLIASGTANITALGGNDAAGIGGGGNGDGGTVITNDTSTITATGSYSAAGIGGGGNGGSGGTVTTNDTSTITATGGGFGAGIGGGAFESGGTVTTNDTSTITATGGTDAAGIGGGVGSGVGSGLGAGGTVITNDASTITATGGGEFGAGIGGGIFGAGGAVVIGGASTVIASGGFNAVGNGDSGTVFGSVSVEGTATLRVPSGDFVIPDSNTATGAAGSEVTVADGATIAGSDTMPSTFAQVSGTGQINNAGTITLPTANVGVDVFEHHYTVSFTNSNGANPASVTVFAESFTTGDRTFPTDPTPPANATFGEWNTIADGSGTMIDADSVLAGASTDGNPIAVALFAFFLTDQAITFTSTAPVDAEPGDTYTVTATGGSSGNPVTFTIDPATASVCSTSGATVTFNTPGDCTILADQTGNTTHNPAPQATQTVTVTAIDQTITFTSTAPVDAEPGDTYTVAATGGGSGNPATFTIDPATASVCNITGSTVTFNTPGDCTILADQTGNTTHNPAPQATQTVTVTAAPDPDPAPLVVDDITAVSPQRFADTRTTGTTFDGEFQGELLIAAGTEYRVQIAGRGQIPADAAAVVANITAIGADSNGYITAHPCLSTLPLASALNYTTGVNLGNEIIMPLADNGELCLYTSADTELTVDVVGYIAANTATPAPPARYADTRANGETIDGQTQQQGTIAAGDTLTIPIAERNGIPADAAGVIVNVIAVNPEGNGFFTVHPCLDPLPLASALNYTTGVNRANEIVAELDTNGDLCVTTSTTTHIVADVVGYIPATSNFNINAPARYLDTRTNGTTIDNQFAATGPLEGDTELRLALAGRPGIDTTAATVIVNVAAINPTGNGFITIHPCADPRPNTASLNYTSGTTGANEIIVTLDDGDICIYTSTTTDLTIDTTTNLN